MTALQQVLDHYKRHERQYLDVPEWGGDGKPIDAVVADYRARETQYLDVAEWGAAGVPLRIHWRLLSPRSRKALLGRAQSDAHIMVDAARDAAGERLFQGGDAYKIMRHADQSIVSRVAAAILNSAPVERAQAQPPLRVHWSLLTVHECQEMSRALLRQGAHLALHETAARMLADKATDAAGKRLFEAGDIDALLEHADYLVVKRVYDAMLAGVVVSDETVEDARKN